MIIWHLKNKQTTKKYNTKNQLNDVFKNVLEQILPDCWGRYFSPARSQKRTNFAQIVFKDLDLFKF